MLQTEFEFTLPCGFVDERGTLHRQGVMRRATALDEVEPLADPRVRANEAYLTILLLSRVVARLGTLARVDACVIERLFASDYAFLQELYAQVNAADGGSVAVSCPRCGGQYDATLVTSGGE
jgi:hypothetical protein